jgi:membrane fusion protein, multidrug efflux system
MEQTPPKSSKERVGRLIRITTILGAALSLLTAVLVTDYHPRTDDASVRANFIEITAEVNGKLVALPVKDNAFVKKGDLLFEIDPRPYAYALQQALSDQEALEQQIVDAKRKIASEKSAVEAATAAEFNSKTGIKTAGSGVDVASASVNRAKANVVAAEAQLTYATNNLHRVQPLLQKQYVTVDQVDLADTAVRTAQGNYDQALAALREAEAQHDQSVLHRVEADAAATESTARLGQAIHNVDTLDTLMSQRPGRASRVDQARLDLERCRVVAPFDAYVTNMNISLGAYARPGGAMFTLIDTTVWYVVANYRESKLKHIHIGSTVDVFLMGHPDRKFHGVIESIGYGVFPEDGAVQAGLPQIERTLNWVHLSSRFPVRVRVQDPDPTVFRLGATAVTVVR